MKQLMLAVFPMHEDADTALFNLKDNEFDSKEISVITREDNVDVYRSKKSHDGLVSGSVLGGLAGLIIAATPVLIPGVGILVAGPLALLTSIAMGTVTGGVYNGPRNLDSGIRLNYNMNNGSENTKNSFTGI